MEKIKLVEKFQVSYSDVEELKEKTLLHEKAGQFTCFAVLKRVPVSRYTENKNGRIYGKAVWDEVARQGIAEGTFCLADHPEDDGSVKNIVGIWKNLRVESNMVYGDLWLIEGGHGYGVLFYNTVKAGGKCGLSSVGYGELDPYDNKTVMPASYELVRLGDWVLDPSQNVFATFENLEMEDKPLVEKPIEESVEKAPIMESTNDKDENEVKNLEEEKANLESGATVPETPIEESSTDKKEDMEMSQLNEASISEFTKIQEAHLKNQVKTLIREARKADANLVDVQRGLQETVVPANMPELKEQVQAEIDAISAKLEEQVKSTQKSLTEKDQSFAALKEKHTALQAVAVKLKEKYESLKETNATLVSERAAMLKDIEQFAEDRQLMESDIAKFSELVESYKKGSSKASKLIEADVSQLKEDRKLMEKDIAKFMEERELMEKDIKIFEEDRANMLLDMKQLLEDRENMNKDIEIFVEERKAMQADIQKLVKALKEKSNIEGYNKPDGKDEVTYKHSMNAATAVSQGTEDPEKSGENKAAMTFKRPVPGKYKESAFDKGLEGLHSDVEEEEENEEKEDKMGMKKPMGMGMKESVYTSAIKELYTEAAKKFPALKDHEKQILASRSLTEAVRKIEAAKERVRETPVRLSEGSILQNSRPEWLGKDRL